jgi:hypothetical protein
MSEEMKMKLKSTQFLKSTGILDAYESVIDTMVSTGWPDNSTIYEHAAYELLRWHALNRDHIQSMKKLPNPG